MDLIDTLMGWGIVVLFYLVPVAVLAMFIFAIIKFIKRDKSDEVSCTKRKTFLLMSILAVIVTVIYYTLIVIALSELDHM